MENKMVLRKADPCEASLLCRLSRIAFDSDVNVGADSAGGPPMYDNIEWHESIAKQGLLYTALVGGEIVGGAILYRESQRPRELCVGRIFIDPKHFRKGYGLMMMARIEEMFTDADSFSLDTPEWNIRTNNFYRKVGYEVVKKEHDMIFFLKTVK